MSAASNRSPYRGAAIVSIALATIMLALGALAMAVPPKAGFDQPDPCSEGKLSGGIADEVTREERTAYASLRYDDSIRALPPARLCRVYGVPISAGSEALNEALLGERANPPAWWWIATGVVALISFAIVRHRRRFPID